MTKTRRRKLCCRSLRTKNLRPTPRRVRQSQSMNKKSETSKESLRSNLSSCTRWKTYRRTKSRNSLLRGKSGVAKSNPSPKNYRRLKSRKRNCRMLTSSSRPCLTLRLRHGTSRQLMRALRIVSVYKSWRKSFVNWKNKMRR